ncbi:cob(I)yrinic acid a,c-diamide adenosyltransferase [Erythrobacter arachoides]|uniref:Corrinoid adenosyltransferase n=1 Tax=Aurantiacibacter arachoides TaxID=1850444 RepID=A0A845A5R7_9SPHN|nr:cob(I)yrinic acid a,c-diamide adenosyltransferase [Aurantiacibacter arachoides]MXO94496.1 cob(I)yrinic acid a,c-diamide adenosyltransferase [Aurantiacibacter arachoides]GGD62992.1 cob(I)yrinic acid a,c-diamide adenosyltransferase [Aurantiacibacter arachoides]
MVKLNKIYTRTGDDGTTGLVDGSRLPKHAARMEAVGAVDEANAALGFAVLALDGSWRDDVVRLQNDLFDLGADLATPLGSVGGDDFAPSDMVLRIVPAQVDWIEGRIDAVNDGLQPLTSFILPGGSEAAVRLHLARTAARRAERVMTALAAEEPVNPAALAFVNRLSDYLFVLCRAVNDGGKGDVLWRPGASRGADR